MSVQAIIIAAVIVGGVGLFIGFFLGVSGEKFKVEVDEREEAIVGVISPSLRNTGSGFFFLGPVTFRNGSTATLPLLKRNL